MSIRSDTIHKKAVDTVRACGTRDPLKIAQELGVYVDFIDDFRELLGMYTYRHRERHILLNSHMDELLTRMVCAHELGHDALHRELAKSALPEFVLFDMRSRPEYEANAFAAHLLIDDDELTELMKDGHDVVQLAALMGTDINLMLIKLNELNHMGYQLSLPYIPRGDFLKDASADMGKFKNI